MKQLTKTSYQKLKNELLTALQQTQENYIEKTGETVYTAPKSLDDLEKMLISNGHVDLENGPKLTESGIALINLCGVEL